MADTVELIIKLINAGESLKTLGNLQKVKDDLNRGEITLRLNTNELRRQATDLRKTLDTLTKQRNDIVFGIAGLKDAEAHVQRIQGMIRDLGRQMALPGADRNAMEAQMRGLQSQLSYWQHISYAVKNGADGLRAYDEAIARTKEQLTEVRRNIEDNGNTLRNYSVAQKEINAAIREEATFRKEVGSTVNSLNKARAQELADAKELSKLRAEALKNDLDAAARILENLNPAVERLKQNLIMEGAIPGKTIAAIGQGLSSVGKTIESMGGIFTRNNIVDTLERYATVMGSRMFTQNWGKAFERYDILSTYSDYLDMVGVSAANADASLAKLNAGIQGIPVGLSDVAYQTRMYQMYVDDLERATNLAIGLERALVAGGANEQMRNTARYEIDRLLSAGELSTSRQYRALMQGLGVSSRFLREEMGYGDLSNAEFINQLFRKQISGEELIRGIESLADSDKLNKAIEVYRTTIESGLSNIGFALTRGKANILSALNDTLETSTGKNISGWLYSIRDAINEVYIAAQEWITANPERIKGVVDTFVRMFNRLREIDGASIVEGMVSGFEKLVNTVISLSEKIPDGWFESFVVFSTVWATPVGRSMTIVGDALQGLGNAIAKFGSVALLSKAGFSLIEQLSVVAPGAAAAMTALGKSAMLAAAGTAAAAAALVAGIAIVSYSAKRAEEQAQAIRDREGITEGEARLEEYRLTQNAYKSISQNLDESGRGEAIREIHATKDELLELDKVLKHNRTLVIERKMEGKSRDDLELTSVDREKFAALKRELEDAYSIDLRIDPDTGSLDAHSQKLAEAAVAYDEYTTAQEQAAVAEERIKEASAGRDEKLRERTEILEEIARAEAVINDIRSRRQSGRYDEMVQYEEYVRSLKDALTENGAAIDGYDDKIAALDGELGRLRNTMAGIRMSSIFGSQEWNELSEPREAVEGLINAYRDLAEEAQKSIDSQIKGFEKFKAAEDVGIGTLGENIQSQIDALDKFNVNIGTIQRYALETGNETLQQLTADLANQGVSDGAAYAQGVVNEINRIMKEGEGADTSKLDDLIKLYDEKRDKEKLAAEATQFVNAAASAFEEAIGEIQPGDLDQMGLFAKMLYGSSSPEELAKTLQEFKEGETSLPNWFASIRTAAEEDVPVVNEQINTTLQTVQTLTTTGIVPLKDAEDQAKTSTDLLKEAINQLAATMSAKLVTVMAFKAGIELMTQSVNVAKSAVEALRDAINSLQDKTVNVVGGEGLEGLGGETGSGATGGLITGPHPAKYYAKGGFVFMKPKGTDTVPAMLTPGEYVLRKRAVDQLGVPFLRSLNRLDIGAAFDNLMSRVYRPSISGMMSYNNTVNRYDNRSYSVNQNIHTNNPDYSYRIANRFAHAL